MISGGITKSPAGIAMLDEILDGGLSKNAVIVIAGAPATGKSQQWLFSGFKKYKEKAICIGFTEYTRYISQADIYFVLKGHISKMAAARKSDQLYNITRLQRLGQTKLTLKLLCNLPRTIFLTISHAVF